MAKSKTKTKKAPKAKSNRKNPFQFRSAQDAGRARESQVHVYGKGVVCDTESRGHKTSRGRSLTEIVVDASEGFIPLWEQNTTLRWRFRESSMQFFQNPAGAMTAIRELFGEVVLAWGDAAPVKFAQRDDAWDFEIVMSNTDRCNNSGCVLAMAFFPDAGRHQLWLYPKMFEQTRQEQLETLEHEVGHVFGLRHFFAKISEADAPSEVFGTHVPFTIMNYGSQSVLTPADKADLKRLYQLAWGGELTQINGTPIRFVRPYHTIGEQVDGMVPLGTFPSVFQPRSNAAYRGRF